MNRVVLFLVVGLLGNVCLQPAYANNDSSCSVLRQILAKSSSFYDRVIRRKKPEIYPPEVGRWLHAEQKLNSSVRNQPHSQVQLLFARASREEVTLAAATGINPNIISRFVKEDHVLWPVHPYNRHAQVPYRASPAVEASTVYPTASRSLAEYDPAMGLISIKTPTDYPHPYLWQGRKADLSHEADDVIPVTNYLSEVDRKFKRSSRIMLLKDVLVVKEADGNAFIVRDLNPMLDGNRYLPGFALGRRRSIYSEAVPEALGKATADLLLRYGMVHSFPHAQNILLQLDRSGNFTGKIVYRDLGDGHFILPILESAGLAEAKGQLESQHLVKGSIHEEVEALGFAFYRSALPDHADFSTAARIHFRAYFSEIFDQLGIVSGPLVDRVRVATPGDMIEDSYVHSTVRMLDEFLSSPEGREALRKYHAKIRLE